MSVNYTRINWEDTPSTQTPINAENLNAMDSAIDDLAGAVNDLDGVPGDLEELENDVTGLKNDLNQLEDKVEGAYNAYVIDTASGAIASFPDGADDIPVKDLSVAIEPVQDLHGQSAPYPAGGGKNLYEGVQELNTIPFDPALTYDVNVAETCTFQFTASSDYANSDNYWLVYLELQDGTKSYATPTAGQTVSKVVSATSENPLKHIYVRSVGITAGKVYNLQLEKGSSATTFAPYSNICPISGWTGANVTRTGKNKLHITFPGRTNNGVTYTTNADGTISLSGTATDASYFAYNYGFDTEYMSKLTAGTYTISGAPNANIRVYGTMWSLSGTSLGTTEQDTGNGVTFTCSEDIWFSPQIYVASGTNTNGVVVEAQVETGSSKTAYEPYQGETYEVDWTTEAGTVYGGTLDVVSGELTVDMFSVDLGSMSWYYVSDQTYSYFRADLDTIMSNKRPANNGVPANMICTKYKTSDANSPYLGTVTNCVAAFVGNSNIAVYDTAYTSAIDFKNSASGVMLVYEIATPQTYQLTPQEVSTVLGQNNIFADCGNVTVQYRADTKLYIDKVLSA